MYDELIDREENKIIYGEYRVENTSLRSCGRNGQ
jgi:hypothetical protein